MTFQPALEPFTQTYEAGLPQVVWTRLIDDLETPVSAYLKIGHGRDYAFLYESVEGGTWRGRYSIVAMKPDLVWRCHGDQAEITEGSDIAAGRFTPQSGGALDSLRDLVTSILETNVTIQGNRLNIITRMVHNAVSGLGRQTPVLIELCCLDVLVLNFSIKL